MPSGPSIRQSPERRRKEDLRIWRAVRRDGVSVVDAAGRFGVQQRMVYRVLAAVDAEMSADSARSTESG